MYAMRSSKKRTNDDVATIKPDDAKRRRTENSARQRAHRQTLNTVERKAIRAQNASRQRTRKEALTSAERQIARARKTTQQHARREALTAAQRQTARARNTTRQRCLQENPIPNYSSSLSYFQPCSRPVARMEWIGITGECVQPRTTLCRSFPKWRPQSSFYPCQSRRVYKSSARLDTATDVHQKQCLQRHLPLSLKNLRSNILNTILFLLGNTFLAEKCPPQGLAPRQRR